MTAFLVFLAFGLFAWAVSEALDTSAHKDARRRNHAHPKGWRR